MKRANMHRLAAGISGVLILLVISPVRAAERRPEDLGVIPTPQEVIWSGETLTIDGATKILLAAAPSEGAKFAASDLRERLREQTGLALEIVQDPGAVAAGKRIAIGNPRADKAVAELMKAYGLELSEAMAKEGYVLGIGAGRGDRRGKRPRPALRHGDLAADAGLRRNRRALAGGAGARLAEDGDARRPRRVQLRPGFDDGELQGHDSLSGRLQDEHLDLLFRGHVPL